MEGEVGEGQLLAKGPTTAECLHCHLPSKDTATITSMSQGSCHMLVAAFLVLREYLVKLCLFILLM